MNQNKGFFAILTTAAIFGSFGVLIRLLAQSFSNYGQVFIRCFFAVLAISCIVLLRKINPFKVDRGNRLYVFLFSIFLPLNVLTFTFSANLIKVTNSLFMLYVGSLITTAVLGKFLFKEKFGTKHMMSLGLVLTGLSFFVYPFEIKLISLGLVLGILSGIFEGATHTLRKLMKNVKREVIVFYQSLSGTIIALGFVLFSNEVLIKEFSLSAMIIAAIFGLLLVVIGYLLAYGFANIDVNLGTIILSTELFFALILNAIFLKEYPTTFELIGGMLIFLAAIVTSLQLGKK